MAYANFYKITNLLASRAVDDIAVGASKVLTGITLSNSAPDGLGPSRRTMLSNLVSGPEKDPAGFALVVVNGVSTPDTGRVHVYSSPDNVTYTEMTSAQILAVS